MMTETDDARLDEVEISDKVATKDAENIAVTEKSATQMLETTRELAQNVRLEANSQTKFEKFEKGKSLKAIFNRVTDNLEAKHQQIIETAERDPAIATHLAGLHKELDEVNAFLKRSKTASLFFAEAQLKTEAEAHETRLLNAETLLFDAVPEPEPPAADLTPSPAVEVQSEVPAAEVPGGGTVQSEVPVTEVPGGGAGGASTTATPSPAATTTASTAATTGGTTDGTDVSRNSVRNQDASNAALQPVISNDPETVSGNTAVVNESEDVENNAVIEKISAPSLETTRELAQNVRLEANSQTKFEKFKKGKSLKAMFNHVTDKLEAKHQQIIETAEKDPAIATHLAVLHKELDEVNAFLKRSKTASLFFAKAQLKTEAAAHETRLLNAETLLFDAVPEPEPPAADSTSSPAVEVQSEVPAAEVPGGGTVLSEVPVTEVPGAGAGAGAVGATTASSTSYPAATTVDGASTAATATTFNSAVASTTTATASASTVVAAVVDVAAAASATTTTTTATAAGPVVADVDPEPILKVVSGPLLTQNIESVTKDQGPRNKDPERAPKGPEPTAETAVAGQEAQTEYMDAQRHFHGIGLPQNYNHAFEHFTQAATHGHADSLHMLAHCLRTGRGVARDEPRAHLFLEQAVSAGSAEAMNEMAMCLLSRARSASCVSKREELSHSHVAQGPSAGMGPLRDLTRNLGTGSSRANSSRQDEDGGVNAALFLQRGIRLLLEAAGAGHADAQCNLGLICEEAGEFQDAMAWYERAMTTGCVRATNLAGLLYFDGFGPSLDLRACKERAFTLFSKAARGGSASACCNAGLCLEQGVGVSMSLPAAIDMYRTGAMLNSPRAMYNLGYLLVRGALEFPKTDVLDNVPLAPYQLAAPSHDAKEEGMLAEGVRWLHSAADGGVAEAGYQLGRLYELGRGVSRDYTVAYFLYVRAAQQDNAKAALCAANMLYYGSSIASNGTTATAGADPTAILKNKDRATDLYRVAALAGLSEAMNALALLLEDEATRLELQGRPEDPFVAEAIRDALVEASKWYFVAAEKGLVEAACNLAILICRPSNEIFASKTLDAVIGRPGVVQHIHRWLAKAIQTAHPRSHLFRATLEQLKVSQFR